jgi:hypothetical protein
LESGQQAGKQAEYLVQYQIQREPARCDPRWGGAVAVWNVLTEQLIPSLSSKPMLRATCSFLLIFLQLDLLDSFLLFFLFFFDIQLPSFVSELLTSSGTN